MMMMMTMMMMMMMMMMTIIKVLRMMGIETSGEEADQLFATVDTNRLDCDHSDDHTMIISQGWQNRSSGVY